DRLRRAPRSPAPPGPTIPLETGVASPKPISTQEAFGRVLVGLARDPAIMRRLVTTSPDVAVSTNLGGWLNKAGVFAREDLPPSTTGRRCCGGTRGATAVISSSASPR